MDLKSRHQDPFNYELQEEKVMLASIRRCISEWRNNYEMSDGTSTMFERHQLKELKSRVEDLKGKIKLDQEQGRANIQEGSERLKRGLERSNLTLDDLLGKFISE